MPDGFTLKEAAAIAELPESVMRTAIEKKIVAPRSQPVGKALRYAFDVKELYYAKLLFAFPFDLNRDDKHSLRNLVSHQTKIAGRWRLEGRNFVLKSDDLVIRVEVEHLRRHLAHNLATYYRGRRRIVSDPGILSGEPIFAGTRIPLAHIAAMIARGVDTAEILEDYPGLSERDLAYAAIHGRMKPDPGRPRKPIELRRHKSSAPAGCAAPYR
jgi:uncharacterized protein (DUF433 family)